MHRFLTTRRWEGFGQVRNFNHLIHFKKFSFGRLIGSGILLRVVIAIVDGIFGLEINELTNFNFYIFGLALAYTVLWMFNKSYSEED